MYGLGGPSGLNMVNQAFIIVIAYWPRRRREIPGIGRYPMGPTIMLIVSVQLCFFFKKGRLESTAVKIFRWILIIVTKVIELRHENFNIAKRGVVQNSKRVFLPIKREENKFQMAVTSLQIPGFSKSAINVTLDFLCYSSSISFERIAQFHCNA